MGNPIDTISIVKAYEVDGSDVKGLDYPKIKVSNHWNRSQFVDIELEGGKTYTVVAKDLQIAIDNAVNAHG